MLPKILVLSLLAAGAMQAEFLRIEVFIRDMSCPSCTDTLVLRAAIDIIADDGMIRGRGE